MKTINKSYAVKSLNGISYKEKAIKLKSIAKKAIDQKIIVPEVYTDLVSRIDNNEFKITIVGEFSSGKSTLIDALIGKDILPHSTSETTATLTYIHSVESGHPKENKAEILFSNGETKLVDFSILKEYVTAFSKTVDVFSTIENVDVYVHIEDFENNIVIVDTPGLNGTNHYEDRTLQEIAKADASIFVFSPSGIKATELSFMKEELLKHQKSFFFVMNRIDDLHVTEGESVEGKVKILAKDVSARFFDGKKEITNIYGVSALKALAAKDTKIQKLYVDDSNTLTNEDRERLWHESNFEIFLLNLKKYLTNEKETVFINSLAAQLSYQLEEYLQQIEHDLITISPKEVLPAAAIIKDEIDTAKIRFANYEQGLEKNVNSRMDSVENNLKNRLTSIVRFGKQRCEEVKRQINSINTIEEFYRVFGEDGSKSSSIVNSFYDRHFEQLKTDLTNEISSVRNDMLLEIRRLIPNIANLKKSSVDSVNIGRKTFTYSSTNDDVKAQTRVQECDERIAQFNEERREAELKKAKYNQDHVKLKIQENRVQEEIYFVNSRISNLGRRPEPEMVIRTRSKQVERHKWDIRRLFGNKYTTKTEEYTDYDYSAQRDYDDRKEKLKLEKSLKKSQLEEIRKQIESLPNMEYQLECIERKLKREMEEKEYQLNEIKKQNEAREKEKAAGRLAFLNNRKAALINSLQSILANEQSELHRSLRSDAKQCLCNLRGRLTDIIRSYFKEESGIYIKQLNVMLDNISSTIENKKIEQKRNALKVSKKSVNALLVEINSIIK